MKPNYTASKTTCLHARLHFNKCELFKKDKRNNELGSYSVIRLIFLSLLFGYRFVPNISKFDKSPLLSRLGSELNPKHAN